MNTPRPKLALLFGFSLLAATASGCGLDAVPAGGGTLGTSGGGATTSQDKSTTSDAGTTSEGDASTSSEDDASTSSETLSSTPSTTSETESSTPETSEESSDQSSTESSSSETDSSTEEPGIIDCDALKFSGFDPGQVPNAVTLTDSEGKDVRLRDYCNDTVVVISGDSG